MAVSNSVTLLKTLAGDLGEEAFDEIQPRGRCRNEVQLEARMFRQPGLDLFGLVGRIVVDNQVKVEMLGRAAVDCLQEARMISLARCRGRHSPMTSPVFTFSAANRVVVPLRL